MISKSNKPYHRQINLFLPLPLPLIYNYGVGELDLLYNLCYGLGPAVFVLAAAKILEARGRGKHIEQVSKLSDRRPEHVETDLKNIMPETVCAQGYLRGSCKNSG